MNSPAIARPPGRSRLALIVAGVVLALFGSLAATVPAQAGYYGDSHYGSSCGSPCGYRHYYNPCSRCGCYRRCGSFSRGFVYERRFVEREYVERRYGGCGYSGCHRYYGGYGRPYGGYDGGYDGGYRRSYGGYYPYGSYRSWGTRRYPWGWGGVRGWQGPYDDYAGGTGYDAGPSGYDY
jgi:hypothetical protein